MKKLVSFLLVVVCLLSLTGCKATKYENQFCNDFVKYVLADFADYEDVEITSLAIYEGEEGGKLAVCSVAYREKDSLKVTRSIKNVTLVLEEIEFSAKGLVLSATDKWLFGDSIEDYHGKKARHGYYKITDDQYWLNDEENTDSDVVIYLWKELVATRDFDIEYDYEKINKKINQA